uniref:Omp-1-10 n=1 Tax=Ehrlichia ewingii TaxID=947 RepID=B1N6B3_9RICK|nr:Omp-1-10 [Ehrlichia ewingii]
MRKKSFIIIGTVLICLLSPPNISFSEVITHNDNKHPGIYVSGQYKPGISHLRKFSVKETNATTVQLVGLNYTAAPIDDIKTSSKFDTPYTIAFQNNIISFSAAIGYSHAKGLRIELEGSYEEFDVTDPGNYTIKDAYRYFAIAREMNSSSNNQPKDKQFTVMRNDGVSIVSFMFNGCYDFPLGILEISPYICAGIGGDFIEFFDALHIKPAYQGKLGLNYPLFSKVSLFIDGYYHKVIGQQFKHLNVQHVVTLDTPKIASVVATLDVSYFGGEIGMRLIF